MIVTTISPEYTVHIPNEFRQLLAIGQEVAISADPQGRLIITPVDQIRVILMESFGMWADRTDLPQDSIEYVDDIRRGERLNQLSLPANETH
jgi:bifunctional DNA-binding transcriptional regulator/antitoxin component of YhaV-PrlF toxin-antitoxin module